MPKDLYEIRHFTSGLMSAPSEADIPDDAASYSLNIDPSIEDGKLAGIPDDIELETTGFDVNANVMTEIEHFASAESQSALLWYDPTIGRLTYIDNFYNMSSPYLPNWSDPIVQATDLSITFSPYNHAVHIGLGVNNDPQWFGYLGHDQLGVAPPNTPVLVDARLEKINKTTMTGNGLYKLVDIFGIASGTVDTLVGFEYGATTIRSINSTTGAEISSSSDTIQSFTRLQAICKCIDITIADAGFDATQSFWVYDRDSTEYGTIYLIRYNSDTDVWTIIRTVSVIDFGNGLENPNTYELTDMEQTIETAPSPDRYRLWFSFHNFGGPVKVTYGRSGDPDNIKPMNADLSVGYATLLFRTSATTSPTSTVSMVNVTPCLTLRSYSEGSPGQFCHSDDVISDYHYFDIDTFMKPLCPGAAGSGIMGYFFNCRSGTIGAKIIPSDNTWRRVGLCAYLLTSDAVAGSASFPTTSDYIAIRGVATSGLAFDDFGTTDNFNYSIDSFQAIRSTYNIVLSIGYSNRTLLLAYSTDLWIFVGTDDFSAHYYNADGTTNLTWQMYFLGDGRTVTDVPSGYIFRYAMQGDALNIPLSYASIAACFDYSGANRIFVCKESGGMQVVYVPFTTDVSPDGNEFGTPVYIGASDLLVIPRVTESTAYGIRKDREYRYYLAYEYDKSQIGPLSDIMAKVIPSIDERAIFVDVMFKSTILTNQRVSGLYLFRSYAEGFVDVEQGSTPKMLKYIDLSKTVPQKELEGFGTSYYFVSVKDADALGATFDSIAGYPSTAEQCTPNYGVSCVGQGYNFVTSCGGIEGFSDATNYVFRSQPNRMDQFNLTEDFCILPQRPLASVFYNGKLYCFSNARSWVINALGDMYVEDQVEGVGCESSESIVVTDLGLFVAGTNNIYINTGNGFQPIGEPVLRSNTLSTGYLEREMSVVPVCSFDEKRMAFIVTFETGAGQKRSLAFSPLRKRWDLWEAPDYDVKCSHQAKNGKILLAGSGGFTHYLGSTSLRAYTWWSKVIDVGTSTIRKIWYEFRAKHSGGTVTMSITTGDGANYGAYTVYDPINKITVLYPESKVVRYGMILKLSSVVGNCYIDSISTIFRRKIGAR